MRTREPSGRSIPVIVAWCSESTVTRAWGCSGSRPKPLEAAPRSEERTLLPASAISRPSCRETIVARTVTAIDSGPIVPISHCWASPSDETPGRSSVSTPASAKSADGVEPPLMTRAVTPTEARDAAAAASASASSRAAAGRASSA